MGEMTTAALLEPGVEENARNLLANRGRDVRRVIRVDRDAILFIDSLERPRTAWLRYVGASVKVAVDEGFPTEPSPRCRRELDEARACLLAPTI